MIMIDGNPRWLRFLWWLFRIQTETRRFIGLGPYTLREVFFSDRTPALLEKRRKDHAMDP